MLLPPDEPSGRPSFGLAEDQVATIVDVVCRGAAEARAHVTAGMLEVPITRLVRKGIRRVKLNLHLTNLQLRAGEFELDDMASNDPVVLGRIDITLQFLHQFGDEDAYVAVECKRVGAGLHSLNKDYVSKGVDRFVTGQYATGHHWGFLLGYVLVLPVDDVAKSIDSHTRSAYGDPAQLLPSHAHECALSIMVGKLQQSGGHTIYLQHILIDMTPAA